MHLEKLSQLLIRVAFDVQALSHLIKKREENAEWLLHILECLDENIPKAISKLTLLKEAHDGLGLTEKARQKVELGKKEFADFEKHLYGESREPFSEENKDG